MTSGKKGNYIMKEKWLKHSIAISIAFSLALGFCRGVFSGEGASVGIFYGVFYIYPLILTCLNLFFIFGSQDPVVIQKSKHFEYLTLTLGSIYSIIILPFTNIVFVDWQEVLANRQHHTPIWSQGAITILSCAAVGIAGYLFLSAVSLRKVPPLLPVLAIGAMYIGMFQCILWIIQVFQNDLISFYLCLFPFNLILIGIHTIRRKVEEWNNDESKEIKKFHNPYLERINKKVVDSSKWPGLAFLFMWPLLGALVCFLLLFGQRPDNIIKAWTETSNWNLSTKVSPQNIYYDEHYLCTVAAGGHPKIVKPIRKGMRHGHEVIVNRQLCIANAFEQVMEEYTPVFHRHIRKFYDKYGFPVARAIRSPYIADVVYILMKPLEVMFLLVLYTVDVNPENRIAVQYLPLDKDQIQRIKDINRD